MSDFKRPLCSRKLVPLPPQTKLPSCPVRHCSQFPKGRTDANEKTSDFAPFHDLPPSSLLLCMIHRSEWRVFATHKCIASLPHSAFEWQLQLFSCSVFLQECGSEKGIHHQSRTDLPSFACGHTTYFNSSDEITRPQLRRGILSPLRKHESTIIV